MKTDDSSEKVKEAEVKKVEEFGAKMYSESAQAIREVGAKIIVAIIVAILVWVFAELIFTPIAEGMDDKILGWPLVEVINLIVVIALAIIIFTVFIYIRRISTAFAGILVYHFGKAGGETRAESYKNYTKAMDGILYVIVISLVYLLFKDPLAEIHGSLPAILLVFIIIWAIITLWRSLNAMSEEIGRYTSKVADELEKQTK
ncbi:MAG TPA: hypothetical protein ENN25_07655 [Euryarchaeota archaeon]|nr:hypothetical protein [Euryarchaeota archaeon]